MFKVGQRVRVKDARFGKRDYLVGHEGVIVGRGPQMPYLVDLPNAPQHEGMGYPKTHWQFHEWQLEPLTDDPAADAFIASIKRLKPYEEPLRTLSEREMDRIMGGGA